MKEESDRQTDRQTWHAYRAFVTFHWAYTSRREALSVQSIVTGLLKTLNEKKLITEEQLGRYHRYWIFF
jgi:hypothetical protein